MQVFWDRVLDTQHFKGL